MARTSLSGIFLLLVAMAFIAMLALVVAAPAIEAVISSISLPQEESVAVFTLPFVPQYLDHAELTHQADALQARNCQEHHGWKAFFIEKKSKGIHFLCSYPGEKTVYTWIADWSKELGTFVERTAFPKAPSLSSARVELMKMPGGGKWMDTGKIEHLYTELVKLGLK